MNEWREPCARTVPEAVLGALAFMEKAGSVAETERTSLRPGAANFCQPSKHKI